MSLGLSLERGSDQPLYRQIVEQIRDQIYSGVLPAGSQLPTVRSLAESSGITRITVQTAYAELQSGGWIDATVGRGTFVSERARQARHLPDRQQPVTADVVIDDMLQISRVQGVRSLANASPDTRLFPAQEFWGIVNNLQQDALSIIEYGSTQGDEELRIEIAGLVAERGVSALPAEIIVTNGATQALSLVVQALCRPGDTVLVEEPTYLSFLNILRAFGVRALGVAMDEQGILPDALEQAAIQARPRFLYTIPTFQNPTGITMSEERRAAVLEIANRHGFLVVEDDLYARIALNGPPPLAVRSLPDGDNVVYISSFSKTLMPGLRVGYAIANPSLLRRMVDLRRATDLCGPSLMQRAVAEFVRSDGYRRHLRRVIPQYRERRETLMNALSAFMPAGVTWHTPEGGYCCWVKLPEEGIYEDLYAAGLRQGWAIAPGHVFSARVGTTQAFRICFGQHEPAVLRRGVETVANLIRTRMNTNAVLEPRARDWAPIA
jgi:DNA-binding transcriptional MocR family regulator